MLWSLAWRNIWTHKSRAILNTIGIALGVGLIFAVLSLSKTLVSSFDTLYGSVYGDVDLVVSGQNGLGTVPSSVLTTVRHTSGVSDATADVNGVFDLVKNGKASGNLSDQISTDGVDPTAPDLTGSTLSAGRRVKSGYEMTLDNSFASANNIYVGDRIKVVTTAGEHTFKIVGLTKFGSAVQSGGEGFAAIPITVARVDLGIPTGFSEIDVQVSHSVGVDPVESRLRKALPSNIEVTPPSQKSSSVDSQLKAFDSILDFFAAMAAFVGAFLILNSFNMTVAQRLREIGMLRTIGASRRQITRAILIEALLLSFVGSPLGLLVGWALSHVMASLVSALNFPLGTVKLPWTSFVIAPVTGIAATVLGAMRPAVGAGRVPPIQAVLAEISNKPVHKRPRVIAGIVLVVLGMFGIFEFAASATIPFQVVLVGVVGIVCLLGGVVYVAPVIVPPLVGVLSRPICWITPVEGRIAADTTRANPLRTAATASGLMIGVALVAAIGTLGSSLIGSISEQLNKQLLTDYTIQPQNFRQGGQGSTTQINHGLVHKIDELPGVKLATGVRLALVNNGYANNDYVAIGYDPKVRAQVTTVTFIGQSAAAVYKKVAQGEVTIGGQLWRRTHVKAGQAITIQGPGAGNFHATVAGVIDGSSLEDQDIGMSVKTFQALTALPPQDSQIDVLATSSATRAALGRELTNLIGTDYPDLAVLSNAGIKNQVKSQENQIFAIFYAIMLVAVLVSLLGVVNTMLISVLERTREIGVLRAIGSSRWRVRRMITDESVLLTVAGAVMGLVVGLGIGYAYVQGVGSGLSGIYFRPPVTVAIAVAVASVFAGLIAAVIPAQRAAEMNIIEAISYE